MAFAPDEPVLIYFTFLPATVIGDFPALLSDVPEAFGFSFFGFLVSLLLRLLLPLVIEFPFKKCGRIEQKAITAFDCDLPAACPFMRDLKSQIQTSEHSNVYSKKSVFFVKDETKRFTANRIRLVQMYPLRRINLLMSLPTSAAIALMSVLRCNAVVVVFATGRMSAKLRRECTIHIREHIG